ncbi:MAG: DUF922 domain-containing protein, partial [Flavobacteriales bacterium]|nr:DUF922 domain-containing protein [Flavobacteriales bacterium]
MKSLVLLSLILFLSMPQAFSQSEKGYIYWSEDRPLTWKDFKGKPSKTSYYHAQTQGVLNYGFDNTGPGAYTFKLNVKFSKNDSWAKPEETTDNLLRHEQGHFDIYEIYGRIIMKKIQDSKALDDPKFSDIIEKIFKTSFTELQDFQKEYDKETNHSKDKDKQ